MAYDLRASLRVSQQAKDTLLLKKMGAQRTAANMIQAYMAPNELSDLYNRLGSAVALSADEASVSDYSYPPYNIDVQKSNLGVRVGGFKQLNEKINQIQNLYRTLTGEIRTKITEWDISLYLQEGWIGDQSIFDLSLLYRIFVDNPSQYTDTRALVYGVLNAAMSYEYKDVAYNPTADPDLLYWVPPTDHLSAGDLVPQPWAGPRINEWQRHQIETALAAGWTSWYPPYWQLFFNSEDPSSLNFADFPAIVAHMNELRRSRRRKVKQVPGIKPAPSLFTSPDATGSTAGLNLNSPIWRGYPYGRNPDPRSIKGYLDHSDGKSPKIDVVSTADRNINRTYPYGNPLDGLDKLLNGWTSHYNETTYQEEVQEVYAPATGRRGREPDSDQDVYTTRTVTVPVLTPRTASGHFPTATGTLTIPSVTKRSVPQKVFGLYGGRANGRDDDSDSVKTWKTEEIEQNIDSAATLQIMQFDSANQEAIDNLLSVDYSPIPAIIVGSKDPVLNKPTFVLIAPIQKVKVTLAIAHTAYFLWQAYTSTAPKDFWVYQIDMSNAQGFSIDTSSQDIAVLNPHLPIQYFADGVSFTGIYFDLPKRTLSANANVITDGWSGVSFDSTHGAAIATALLNPLWYDSTAFNRAPLHRILSSLSNSLLNSLGSSLSSLATLFAPGAGDVMKTMISQLPTPVQAKPTMQTAITLFSNSSTGAVAAQVTSLASAYASVMTAISNMTAIRGTYLAKDVQAFYTNYPSLMSGLMSTSISGALSAYLNVLYEQRIILLAKRLNKENGTLMNMSRIETAMGMMQDELVDYVPPVSPLIKEQINIVHKVTNIDLMTRATTDASDLPTEKVRIIYAVVQYNDDGTIIRPTAGNYQLFSKEVLNQMSLTPIEWYITFAENDVHTPGILKNVLTTIDGQKLQDVMANPNLTQLEKVCYARVVEDWWEIKIPDAIQPPVTDYENDLQLVLAQPDAFIEQYLQMTGSVDLNPVAEDTLNIQMGSTWLNEATAQTTLKQLNPS